LEKHIKIRLATPADAESIIEFNIAMALETETKELPRTTIETGVRKMLKQPELGFYIIAQVNTTVAGCLMITREWSDWRNAFFWWIQSVYVQPEYRRQGIYHRLHSFVRTLAEKEHQVCGLRLYVEKNNIIAQKTYQNMGMRETHYKLFEETIAPSTAYH